ncbi:MAG TPA: hypothetical protein VJW51_08705 [Candidatus Acidoferrales bacterium]|nr:hypothetical protein [Candidatus Acidoferrales bacterium]
MTSRNRSGSCVAATLLLATGAFAAGAAALLVAAPAARAQSGGGVEKTLYSGMKWRQIGPFRGGRALAVSGVAGDPETFYFGGTGSGVWKTTNGGQDWTPLFDKQPVSAIGAIAVAPSDPNVIYVGTGEGCIRSTSSHGDGVYKSTDAGKTWTNIGLKDSRQIGRLIVHPRDADIAFVAALGHEFGPNAERGVFRTLDGGKTWEKVLYKDDKTGAIDLAFDPTNPHIVFAALWQANRTPWGLTDGGPGSGLYRSADGGTTWKRLEGNGLPSGILGRIGVSVSGGDPNRVYALIEAEKGGLYASDDGGDHWTLVNGDRNFIQRAWYYIHVFADPKNADVVYVLNVRAFRSNDGGKTFTRIYVPHGDNHGLWIDPTNTNHMIEGNDGGATITYDGGKTWTRQDSQPTAQFYHVATDNAFPYRIYGDQQDNSSVGILSRGDSGVIGRWDWYPVGGGESGYMAPDPRDENIVYATGYMGEITRFDHRTSQVQEIGDIADLTDGEGAANLEHRYQWTSPVVLSPQDPEVIYHGAEALLKSTDQGKTWKAISPDLTRNDKAKEALAGGPITFEDTGAEIYCTIFSIAPSKLEKGLIWVGSDDGLIHVTRDEGKSWANVTPKQIPEFSRVSLIEASPHDPATAYVAYDRHQNDEYRPFVFRTNDYGKTWTKITGGIPEGAFVRAVREDPKRKGLLYAGTETGVLVSFDDGGHWQSLQQNLPTVPVHDLEVKDDDLIAATHGRSFWILDDLTPLRQISAEVAKADAHLYAPALAYRGPWGGGFRSRGPAGQNPPYGVILDYYLKAAPDKKSEVTLEILDGEGKSIRKLSSRAKTGPAEDTDEDEEGGGPPTGEKIPAEAGMNRFVWDMRYPPVPRIPGFTASEYDQGLVGPQVVPGTYRVRLTAGGKTQEASAEIRMDPRMHTPQADLVKEFDLRRKIYERLVEDYTTVNQLRNLRAQLKALEKRLHGDAAHREIAAAGEALRKKLNGIEKEFINPKLEGTQDTLNFGNGMDAKYALLGAGVESADTAPTESEYQLFAGIEKQFAGPLAHWKEITEKDVPAFNAMAQRAGVGAVALGSGKPDEEGDEEPD